ncbi:MAG TPA: hypothetical protein PKA21_09000 [Kiritimatiellia bacterium]|nr:hypothetical protein [Kiritimatiellia bacterium]HMP35009.1 hypothetical protein [Kiritimatiellia bacterium]
MNKETKPLKVFAIVSIVIAVLFMTFVKLTVVNKNNDEEEARKMLAEIQKEFGGLEKAIDSGDLEAIASHKASDQQVAQGEYGEYEKFTKKTINLFAELRQAYQLELEAIGWSKILDPERLSRDNGLHESKYIIVRANQIVDKYIRKSNELIDDIPNLVDELKLSESSKAEFKSSYVEGLKESKVRMQYQWSLEQQVVKEFEKILPLFEDKNSWSVENDQFLFVQDNDVELFNNAMKTINDLVEKQLESQKQGLREAQEALNIN